MDKYGVEYDDKKVKAAQKSKKCLCGEALTELNPPLCPSCGSEKFEKQEEQQLEFNFNQKGAFGWPPKLSEKL